MVIKKCVILREVALKENIHPEQVIAVLDDAGREKLVEVLLGEDLNTYVVSHGWTHPLLEKIEVVKDGNVSKLDDNTRRYSNYS